MNPCLVERSMKTACWIACRTFRTILLASIAVIVVTALFPIDVLIPGQGVFHVTSGCISRVYRYAHCQVVYGAPGIWEVAIASAIIATFFWTIALPTPPADACDRCGYNLTGNVSGRCPECGTQIASLTVASRIPQI
jgi:hypothetical protein